MRDLAERFPGIKSTPGVCEDADRIAGTRIPVWGLVQAKQLGACEADLLHWYPTLRAEDIANAWVYFKAHQEKIEQQIRQNEEA